MVGANCKFVFIEKIYFTENIHFIEMLDPYDEKQSRRNYLFLNVNYEGNNLLVPLRTEMDSEKPFGIIGYAVPSNTKVNAGLDFRKILIVNDFTYIETPEYCRIPQSQQNIIDQNYSKISNLVTSYVKGYISSAIKGREKREPKYRYSTLHNFHKELGIIDILNRKKIMDKPAVVKEISQISNKSIEAKNRDTSLNIK
ncbi:hypothetical protein [Clostridium sp.]|jgi:hypothetical protein|uniref:hypothetical protein n=1 Tax=Clostridium sp. TaxID=1506 RepID=UPI003EEA5DEB